MMMTRTLLMFLVLVLGSGALSPAATAVQDGLDAVTLPTGPPAELRVRTGQSIIVSTEDVFGRVSVTNPEVAFAEVVSPNQLLVHGQRAGSVTLILWNLQDQARAYNLVVDLDVGAAAEVIQGMYPGEGIQVAQSGTSLVLSGTVSTDAVVEGAGLLAGTISSQVVNLVSTIENRQSIMLQVKFAEVDRTAIEQFGVTLFSGAANTIAATTTGQFGEVSVDSTGEASIFELDDLLNIFIFRPDLNLGATIQALEQRSSLEILAEPNVLALNGREASFLAGGEFPFPVVQGGGGGNGNSVSIQFKEFGVRLNFLPEIQPDGAIRLRVTPEVSALDFANALTVSGFLVPALSTRRAETEIELADGQTFAIAGLIDSRLTEAALKVPVLGDIPILGRLFRSNGSNESRTELLVMVTPRLVAPMNPDQVPETPGFPIPFTIPPIFDGEDGEAPAQSGALGPPSDALLDDRRAEEVIP